jgi:hypothetical protein
MRINVQIAMRKKNATTDPGVHGLFGTHDALPPETNAVIELEWSPCAKIPPVYQRVADKYRAKVT